eukprot:scaffold26950_cov72-Skeletonema_dohrnii-CCMP3373.AAC.1
MWACCRTKVARVRRVRKSRRCYLSSSIVALSLERGVANPRTRKKKNNSLLYHDRMGVATRLPPKYATGGLKTYFRVARCHSRMCRAFH